MYEVGMKYRDVFLKEDGDWTHHEIEMSVLSPSRIRNVTIYAPSFHHFISFRGISRDVPLERR